MENFTFNNSVIPQIKELSINLSQLTKNLSNLKIEFTSLKDQSETSNLTKFIRGFSDLANSTQSVKDKIDNVNTLFNRNREGSLIIVENLKLLKKNFIDLGTGIWGAFKNSLSFIGSLITQKGKLQEVIAPMGTFIRRVASSGLTALRAGERMAGAALRGIGIFVANIITATTAQTGFTCSQAIE